MVAVSTSGQNRPAGHMSHVVLPMQIWYDPGGQSCGSHMFQSGHTFPTGHAV
jgi:hypothetical protein